MMKNTLLALILLLIPVTEAFSAIKILAFSGSTRSHSFNQALVDEAAEIARKKGAEVTVINLKNFEMPFYQADLEAAQGMPIHARRFRNLMLAHDKILIATPEYNGSLTAILKNSLDWASRKEEGGFSLEAFTGKMFALMSASPGKGGGKRSLEHLEQILAGMGANIVKTKVVVPEAHQAFDCDLHLKGDDIKDLLQQEITELLR